MALKLVRQEILLWSGKRADEEAVWHHASRSWLRGYRIRSRRLGEAIRQHFLDNEWEQARELQVRMIPVNTAVTRGWGVCRPVKAAMDMLGMYGGPPRAPLLPLSEETKQELLTILIGGKVIEDE